MRFDPLAFEVTVEEKDYNEVRRKERELILPHFASFPAAQAKVKIRKQVQIGQMLCSPMILLECEVGIKKLACA